MASGILGGGLLTHGIQAAPYTTPAGKTTTTSLLLFSDGAAGTVTVTLGSASINVIVPANGIMTLRGIILAAGQGVSLLTSVAGIRYLLTGWESTT